MPPYVPLWCKSNFSFLEGASHPEELVEEAHRLGLDAVSVTDRDGVYGVVSAHQKAQELGVKLLIGSEITVDDGSTVVLLAAAREGYGNLCRLISAGRLASPKGSASVSWRQVMLHAPGLIALWGGERSRLVRKKAPDALMGEMKEAFGDRLYAMLTRHRHEDEAPLEERLRSRARRHGLPVAAACEVLYHSASRRPLQDVLTCIRHRTRLTLAGKRIRPNAEHYLRTPHLFGEIFADVPAMVDRTREIAERCTFSMDQIRYRYPKERLPDGSTSSEWLRRLALEGADGRYGGQVPARVHTQLEKELLLVDELDYPGYFLTMYEIVRFCREKRILCQGRGSAANSVLCYCLGITAVDPVHMELLFERFISKERAEPPDIDLDIEHERREEVIQHVYQKYGRDKAAMVAVTVRYRARSAVRDVGKVLGIPETSLDRLARLHSHFGGVMTECFHQAGLPLDIPLHAHLLWLSSEILDFPRHLSIHPGGFLLGHEPVWNLVPIENGTMPDRTVIQWNKDDVEALGLFKVDLLGLGALTHLHRCFDLLQSHYGIALSMASIPRDDPETFDMICEGKTVGVFQIESRAQMAMLPRLRPRNFYDLVIEVSIVRPGPITGGMVHPYLRRRRGEEELTYPHPCLEPVLKKTLGVPLFQEQVMKLAMVAADYTPGEADQLRRDMAAWRRAGRIERHREKLVTRMTAKGIAVEFAENVFEQIRGFGEYGFPESHAAGFALISYATAWLRCHFPAAFIVSLLNSLPMGFYSPATIVEEAKRMGITVLPIDVARSERDCTLVGSDIRMGLSFVKGLGAAHAEQILEGRPFANLGDLVRRTRVDEGTLLKLAESGALEPLGHSRRGALWDIRSLVKGRRDALPLPAAAPPRPFAPLSDFEEIGWDYITGNHSTRGHPLSPLREQLTRLGMPRARDLVGKGDGQGVRYAGMVICRQRPSTASGVTFMTLEDETGFVNLVIWKDIFERFKVIAKTEPFLGVTGTLQIQEGIVHLIAKALFVPDLALQPTSQRSRDFR